MFILFPQAYSVCVGKVLWPYEKIDVDIFIPFHRLLSILVNGRSEVLGGLTIEDKIINQILVGCSACSYGKGVSKFYWTVLVSLSKFLNWEKRGKMAKLATLKTAILF